MNADDKRLDLLEEVAATFDVTTVSVSVNGTKPSPVVAGGFRGKIRGRDGKPHPVVLYPVRGALGMAVVDRLAATTRGTEVPIVVAAATVGSGLQAALIEQGFGYLDLAGNCHLELDGGNVTVHIEGRRGAPRPAKGGSLRAAGYQVLFVLLADEQLLGRTVRDIATAANVSRHAVHSLMERLREAGVLQRTGRSRHTFAPGGREQCIDRFSAGWADVLRGSLLAGRFRLRERDPSAVIANIEAGFHAAGAAFGFGGGHGSTRLLRYLQSDETVVHTDAWTPALAKSLGAAPDRQGPLFVFRTMTSLDLVSGFADTAHPLLVYAELARSPDPRAREAAALLLDEVVRGQRA